MKEQFRIESRDHNGRLVTTAIIHYDYQCDGKKENEDGSTYWDEYAVLEKVEIEATPYGDLIIECELKDEVIDHFSELLHIHTGLEVRGLVA